MFLRADSTDAANAPAFADVGPACRMPRASRPEAVELISQEVAHAIIGVPGMRAGEDVAFGGDGDVTLPAAAAVNVGLGVLEEPQLGPLAAERGIDVQPHGGPARHEGADARGRGVEVLGRMGSPASSLGPSRLWAAEG